MGLRTGIASSTHFPAVVNVKGEWIHVETLVGVLGIQTSNVTTVAKQVTIQWITSFIRLIRQLQPTILERKKKFFINFVLQKEEITLVLSFQVENIIYFAFKRAQLLLPYD